MHRVPSPGLGHAEGGEQQDDRRDRRPDHHDDKASAAGDHLLLPSEENPTPLVRVHKLNPSPDFQLYAKLESEICRKCPARIFPQCHIALPNGEPRVEDVGRAVEPPRRS